MAGEIGRTPVLVAESTHQPGKKPFTPNEVYGGIPSPSERGEEGPDVGAQSVQEGEKPNWALP